MTDAAFVNPDARADRIIGECVRLEKPTSFFLFAGAGSGKTRSLVTALEDFQSKQRDILMSRSQRIAVITYTNAASEVISQRLKFDPFIHVSTIHSFAWSLIGGYHNDIRKWLRKKLQEDIGELQSTLAKTRAGTKIRLERESSLAEKSARLALLDQIRVFTYSPTGENSGRDSLNHTEVIQISASFLFKPVLQSILVGRFPFLFIDESQDTNRDLIDSLFAVQAAHEGKFCLGLFGDMMQRIYSDGKVGLENMVPPSWAKPEKIMNWRCPKRVVRLINAIRKPVDGREQQAPPDKAEGSARCFIYPSDAPDKTAIETNVANKMATITGDADWNVPERCKRLTLEHHMAARRLGFSDFFLPLYRIGDFRTGLINGTLSGFPLLFKQILPLTEAIKSADKFEIARIVRSNSPLLARKTLAQAGSDKISYASRAKSAVDAVAEVMKQQNLRSIDILKCIAAHELFEIPENLRATLRAEEAGLGIAEDDPEIATKGAVAAWYDALLAPFEQVRLVADYLSAVAKFDTHQGVKGREFPRVMVIMDDEEARGFLFNYDKLFEVNPKSKGDLEHEAKGEETTVDRTRRLFYVTCSRAENSLALVIYTQRPELARNFFIRKGWFAEDEIECAA